MHWQLQLQLHLQQQQHQVRQHIRPPTLPFATSSPSLRDTLTLANQTHHNTHLDAYLDSGFNPLSDFGDIVDTTATACDMASRADSNVSSRRNLYEEFRLTRSRVIRVSLPLFLFFLSLSSLRPSLHVFRYCDASTLVASGVFLPRLSFYSV